MTISKWHDNIIKALPVPVAALSKVQFDGRSPAEIVVSKPAGAWMSVSCVLSGRGLCDELMTCPEESYRLWWVVEYDIETSRMNRHGPRLASVTQETNKGSSSRNLCYCRNPLFCLGQDLKKNSWTEEALIPNCNTNKGWSSKVQPNLQKVNLHRSIRKRSFTNTELSEAWVPI